MNLQVVNLQGKLSWEQWAAFNVSRGCDPEELRRILRDNGFDHACAVAMAGGAEDTNAMPELRPATRPASAEAADREGSTDETCVDAEPAVSVFLPGATRLDSDRAELYGIDGFLSPTECVRLIGLIGQSSRPSTTTDEGVSDFRTSRTCELAALDDPFVAEIDSRICRFMGIDPENSEPIEGQWYDEGQQFKPHTDYFEPDSPAYDEHVGEQGQRSWTFMIYLNTTAGGGETHFPELGATFVPHAGTALIWNNRDAEGRLNGDTLHHGMPVTNGFKAVITKWFRSVGPTPTYTKEANEYLPPLTDRGFMRGSMPPALHATLLDFYRKHRPESTDESIPDFIHNRTGATPSVLIELTEELRKKVHETLQPIVEAWIGDYLEPTYVYGIREYRRGAVLKSHRDRLGTHVASAILNIDQTVDSDWALHIEDHQYRRSEQLLEPGRMILYEGARLAHGRPTPLDGDRYANVFVHFKRRGD